MQFYLFLEHFHNKVLHNNNDNLSFHDFFYIILFTSKKRFISLGYYRIYVPKPGVPDKKRPLTIPPFMDKVVQKANLLFMLEAIYEPYF